MYTTNLPYIWTLARQTFRVLRSSNINTEDKYSNGPYRPEPISSLRSKAEKGLYGLETMNRRVGGAAPSESEENIIKMNGLETGANDFGKYAGGSETVSWAESRRGMESDSGPKGNYIIRKTTEVVINQEEGP